MQSLWAWWRMWTTRTSVSWSWKRHRHHGWSGSWSWGSHRNQHNTTGSTSNFTQRRIKVSHVGDTPVQVILQCYQLLPQEGFLWLSDIIQVSAGSWKMPAGGEESQKAGFGLQVGQILQWQFAAVCAPFQDEAPSKCISHFVSSTKSATKSRFNQEGASACCFWTRACPWAWTGAWAGTWTSQWRFFGHTYQEETFSAAENFQMPCWENEDKAEVKKSCKKVKTLQKTVLESRKVDHVIEFMKTFWRKVWWQCRWG